MSTCSKMYMMKVLTWGSRPTVNSSGKHKMNTERRRASRALCIQWCYNCINGHPLLTPKSQDFWLSNNGFTDPRFQWVPWLQIALLAYLSTHTVYQYEIPFFPLFWGDMAILENGSRKTSFSWDFVVVNWAKRLKNCWMSSRHTSLPNAHWLA